MTYSQIYDHFLEKVRKEVPVYHKNLGAGLSGFYDAFANHIVVNSRLKNTRRGLIVLAHEWTHYRDRHDKKFVGFFTHDKRKYSKERMAEVIAAEQSAGIGAAKICKKYGKKYNPEETNLKELPQLVKFWRKWYFYK